MKRMILFVLSVLFGVPSVATADGWTPWISGYNPPLNIQASCLAESEVMTAASCRGSYCQDMRFYCGLVWTYYTQTASGSFEPITYNGPGTWMPFISNEAPDNMMTCPFGSAVAQVFASGYYSDSIEIYCQSVSLPELNSQYEYGCDWDNQWFSEEHGPTQYEGYYGSSYQDLSWIAGLRCSGDYCDDMDVYRCGVRGK